VTDRALAWEGWYRDEPGTWTRSDVTVTFACSDAGAGLAGAAPPAAVVSGEGAGQLRSGDCVDRVGHVTTATSGAISIDKSPPEGALTCPSPVTVGASASGSWTASDALSGLAGESSGTIPLDTARAGTFTASHEVRDLVGHTATLSCTYRVDEPAAATASATPTSTSTASSTATPTPTSAPLRAPVSTTSARPLVTLRAHRRPVRSGRVRLALACSGAECAGRLNLGASRSRRFDLAAGERATLAMRLIRRERRAFAARGRLVLRVSVRLAGAPATDARRLTVRP
jgi:hypothetical protein